ncbi:MAG TPA: HNH endonuclease [Candidatus Nitrosotenuis sp.]|nr:HNH endonuclease [Candidatus Nitrosotenuis sp.]
MKSLSRTCPRKNARASATDLWEAMEDQFVHRFEAYPSERIVYFHLLRRTWLVGRRTLTISMLRLGESVRMCMGTVLVAVRRLATKGIVRILGRSLEGHRLQVHPPWRLRGSRPAAARRFDPEAANFFSTLRLRNAIFRREKYRCFYCLRKLTPKNRTLDHLEPRHLGINHGYRNIVACCLDCNTEKGAKTARRFFRDLHRYGVLSRREYRSRMFALKAVQAGRVKPILSSYGRRFRDYRPA